MERFKVSIEKQKDGSYIAYNTNVDGYTLLGTGSTVTEAKADFADSMKEVSEVEKTRLGEVPPVFLNEPEYKFDLPSLFEYYSMINVSAFARSLGINDALMRQYRKGSAYISDAQLRKIEDGIHQLGKEFTRLQLA